jgi:tetratricopeptide (TPR) repeat protein
MRRSNKKRSSNSSAAAQLPVTRSWPLSAIGLALIVIAICVVYMPAMRGGQLTDDSINITKPELRSLSGLYRIWTEPGIAQYYPVTHTVFWLEHKLWGDAVLGYHLANLVWHSLAVLLTFAVLRNLKIPGAMLAAAIFALHPVMVESVAWISEQKNLLSTVFYLSALLVYFRFEQTRKAAWYFPALALFALALGSKTATVTLPAALLVIIWWQRGSLSLRRDVVPLVPFLVLAIAAGLMTSWVEHKFSGAKGADFAFTFGERFLLAGRAIWFYLGKLFWPRNLIFIYPQWKIDPARAWQWLFPISAIALTLALWMLRNRSRAGLAAWLYYCGTLFPTLGFLNVSYFLYSFVADHFQYLASLGMITLASAAIALIIARLPSRTRWAGIAFSTMLVGELAMLSMRQSNLYANGLALYQATVDRNPASWRAHQVLGIALTENARLDEAMDHYRQALHLNPRSFDAHNHFGNALLTAGRVPEAIGEFRAALAIRADDYEIHNNLGNALLAAGRLEEAISEFQTVLAVEPDDPVAGSTQAVCLMQLGRVSEAIAMLERIVQMNPEYAEGHERLGIALSTSGDMARAIQHFQIAVQINPDNVRTQNNLATALLRSGNTEEAIAHYEEAVRLQPSFAAVHKSLAEAHRKMGQLEKAIEHYQALLRLQPDNVPVALNLVQTLALLDRSEEAQAAAQRGIEAARGGGQPASAEQLEEWLKHYRIELQRGRGSATTLQSEPPTR